MSSPTTKKHPRRRKSDKGWRSFAPSGQALYLVLISLVLLGGLSKLDGVIKSQKEGRRDALGVSCAISGAVINAGRNVILSSSLPPKPPRFERNLHRLGFPSRAELSKGAQIAATLYARSIAEAVQRQVHVTGIVHKDGTIDCKRLREVARVGH